MEGRKYGGKDEKGGKEEGKKGKVFIERKERRKQGRKKGRKEEEKRRRKGT